MLVLDLKSGQEVCWMLTPRDQLLASHEEFQKLAQEHTQYAQRLDSLTQKRYLTEAETAPERSNGIDRAPVSAASGRLIPVQTWRGEAAKGFIRLNQRRS